jgi:hypothetical protein
MVMEQQEYEKKLQGLVKFIKTNEPASNPSDKKSTSELGMVVVKTVIPQGPCVDCGRKCPRQRVCSHRRDRHGNWYTNCNLCGFYRNPKSGRFERRPDEVRKDARLAKIKKMESEALATEKTSERTKSLLQRLAQILHQHVLPTNDHSGD